MGDVLRVHEVIAARQHGYRPRAQAPEVVQAGGVFKHVDGLEPDRTDREKLFEFRQLVHPGCQNTFSGTVPDMAFLPNDGEHDRPVVPGQAWRASVI